MPEFSLPGKALEPFKQPNNSLLITTAMLDRFLVETSDLELEPSERLRWLAINIEHDQFADGWLSLNRVYDRSIKENPENFNTYYSLAISALNWFEKSRTENLIDRLAIAKMAEERIIQAISLRPKDADLIYIYGQILYNHPERNETKDREYSDRALAQFKRALVKDSSYCMAALYKAHCLHDQKQWQKAFEAYSEVNTEELLKKHPHWKWRVLKLQEQRAFCCAKLNDLDKAAEILSIFLREAENLSDEEAEYDIANLNESVELLTKIIDEPEMLSRLKKIARRTEWEDFYQWETTF